MNLPPIPLDDADTNVRILPVKHRPEPEGPFLKEVPLMKCRHWRGPFEIDSDAAKCKCLECGDEVSAMFVLEKLMNKESRWMQAHERYQDEQKRLAERSRTKCEHCGKITRISGR